MTIAIKRVCGQAAPVQVQKGTSEPEINVRDTMMSSPCWEVIIMSLVISVTVSAQGAEIIFEKHLQIEQVTESS